MRLVGGLTGLEAAPSARVLAVNVHRAGGGAEDQIQRRGLRVDVDVVRSDVRSRRDGHVAVLHRSLAAHHRQ